MPSHTWTAAHHDGPNHLELWVNMQVKGMPFFLQLDDFTILKICQALKSLPAGAGHPHNMDYPPTRWP